MKKATALLLAALIVLTLGACAKGGNIVGTWIDDYNAISFLEDGTVLWAERGSASGSFGSADVMHYSVSGDKLTFKEENETYTFKVQGDKLTINFDGESAVFTKVTEDLNPFKK